MAALTSLSDLVNRMTGGNSGTPENVYFQKQISVAGVADTWVQGAMYSSWLYDGVPGAGVAPTTVAAPTSATVGAVPFTNPGGGRQKWVPQIMAMCGSAANIGGVFVYDRLLHIGNLSGTVLTAQTVGGSLTRNTGGAGNQIFLEIYTPVGTTATTITASYTNQAGTAGRTTQARVFGGTAAGINTDTNAFLGLPLQTGDTGVRSVESVTVLASTLTAGNFGVVVAKPVAWLPVGTFAATAGDFTTGPGGIPELEADACVAFAFIAMGTTEVPFFGIMATVEA